jgi:hypothetical protein
MSRTQATRSRPGSVSRALARDQLGVPAALFFVLAGVAPLTVAAGVIPTAYATTGLTGIPAAFLVIAVILATWASGYVAMTRHIRNAGAFYAFIAAALGRVTGVAAALVPLLAYSFLQVGLYGAFGPNAAAEASAHLGVHAAWWAWALTAWAVVTCWAWPGSMSSAGSWACCCAPRSAPPGCWRSSRCSGSWASSRSRCSLC